MGKKIKIHQFNIFRVLGYLEDSTVEKEIQSKDKKERFQHCDCSKEIQVFLLKCNVCVPESPPVPPNGRIYTKNNRALGKNRVGADFSKPIESVTGELAKNNSNPNKNSGMVECLLVTLCQGQLFFCGLKPQATSSSFEISHQK